ncbi:MAG TPA: hypothetical protein VNY73_02645 [Bacteroidia bacterium]|jgi:hypothetical protein|nr:hypothetical protein [Bacteroidia bacterium]
MNNIKQYYKELGKLVYAIAIVDGSIQPEEVKVLHDFVGKELADHEPTSDSSGMNKAFYVDFEFDTSVEEHLNSREAITSYIRFVHSNYEPTDKALIQRSVKLLEKVAFAYNKQNEKNIIEQVKDEISEIQKTILK